MNILRLLREARGISQEELARSLGVTISQVEVWESGAETPSPVHLKDLALELGCTAEELIGDHDDDSIPIATNTYYLFTNRELEDGFWGHFGVLLPGHTKSKWYPVTLATADYVSMFLRCVDDASGWMAVETLNNRILLINPASVSRIWLLDDAQDQPSDDWELPLDGYRGRASEFYKALEELCSQNDRANFSERFMEALEDFTEATDMGDEELASLVFDTHIFDSNGAVTSYSVAEKNLIELLDNASLGETPVIFDLSCDDFDSFFPSRSISMLDMPRSRINEKRREI